MDEKQAISKVFNLVAEKYDNPSLRFFPACASKLVELADLKPGDRVLDIATGTGVVAMAAARCLSGNGEIHGIDLSENMLQQARKKCQQADLHHIEFHLMDAEQPAFEEDSFDVITCSFGLFFLPDMDKALKNWLYLLKPGGKLVFSSFALSAFAPMSKIFLQQLEEFGITSPTPRWLKLAEEDLCKTILLNNGFNNPQVSQAQLGYHLEGFDNWWDILQGAAYRGLYEQLATEHRDEFLKRHKTSIESLASEDGIWLDVQTLFSQAIK